MTSDALMTSDVLIVSLVTAKLDAGIFERLGIEEANVAGYDVAEGWVAYDCIGSGYGSDGRDPEFDGGSMVAYFTGAGDIRYAETSPEPFCWNNHV